VPRSAAAFSKASATAEKLKQRGLQVVDDLAGDDLRWRQRVCVLQRGVPQPGQVQVYLVPGHEFVVVVGLEPL